jgi:hypothetical protein
MRVRSAVVVALSLGGCSFERPPDVGSDDAAPLDGATSDAVAVDGPTPDAACTNPFTFAVKNVDPCELPASLGDFTFPAGAVDIDTTTGQISLDGAGVPGVSSALMTQAGGAEEAMVIVADDLVVEDTTAIKVVGSRPLILVGMQSLIVRGLVDASGDRGLAGPGADRTCAAGAGGPGTLRVTARCPAAAVAAVVRTALTVGTARTWRRRRSCPCWRPVARRGRTTSRRSSAVAAGETAGGRPPPHERHAAAAGAACSSSEGRR